jgi:hypothetical protein
MSSGQDESGDWGVDNLRFACQPNDADWEAAV